MRIGRIVNLGSGTARIAFGPLISYGPLKAALQSLTLSFSARYCRSMAATTCEARVKPV